jgi:hypothetical protein
MERATGEWCRYRADRRERAHAFDDLIYRFTKLAEWELAGDLPAWSLA